MIRTAVASRLLVLVAIAGASLAAQASAGRPACALDRRGVGAASIASSPSLIVHGARVYTLAWPDPDGDGRPDAGAPVRDGRWSPDASALAIADGRIVAVGDDAAILALRTHGTRVVDARGRTIIPGLVDAHTHVAEYGESLRRVDLVGVRSPAEAMTRVAAWIERERPARDAWILGQGWDEGAWTDTVLTAAMLDARFPGRTVYLRGLHGFAGWASSAALSRAGITARTPDPVGGVIERRADGGAAGRVRNRAVRLLDEAVPPPTRDEARTAWRLGLARLADSGYVGVHEAGVDAVRLDALQSLARECALPVRVHAMLSARDTALAARWLARGPDTSGTGGLTVRAVKAYYDGALGSRGALLLAGYADAPEQRGIAGAAYGFDSALVARFAARGFQLAIHAIGDGGNRAVLDILAATAVASPSAHALRHRVEHAQVVDSADLPRFVATGAVPSLQPVHATEDMRWAGQRLGPARLRGAYAWRSLRRTGATPPLGSDLPGSGFGIGYGLHSAVTRMDTTGAPAGGWRAEERLTIEEAVRGYTVWARRAALDEPRAGAMTIGAPADLTILDMDPFALAADAPARLPMLRACATVVGGRWRDTRSCGQAP